MFEILHARYTAKINQFSTSIVYAKFGILSSFEYLARLAKFTICRTKRAELVDETARAPREEQLSFSRRDRREKQNLQTSGRRSWSSIAVRDNFEVGTCRRRGQRRARQSLPWK